MNVDEELLRRLAETCPESPLFWYYAMFWGVALYPFALVVEKVATAVDEHVVSTRATRAGQRLPGLALAPGMMYIYTTGLNLPVDEE